LKHKSKLMQLRFHIGGEFSDVAKSTIQYKKDTYNREDKDQP
jgi:hypothetical protein